MNKESRNESHASKSFIKAISAAGLSVFVCALAALAIGQLNGAWLLLAIVTILVVSRTDIKIPKIPNTVTLDDTFVYISMFLYGVPSAVVLAGLHSAPCPLHFTNPI